MFTNSIISKSTTRLTQLSRQLSTTTMAPTSTKNSIKHFDYLVIGGGSGGVALPEELPNMVPKYY